MLGLDGVGGALGRGAFDLVGPGGRFVLFGYASGAPVALNTGDLFMSGVTVSAAVGGRMAARPGGFQDLAEQAVAKLAVGEWAPMMHPPFPLADAAQAHVAIASRATTGKVTLAP